MSSPESHPDLPHLPVGQRPRFDPNGMPGWEIFPFEHDGLADLPDALATELGPMIMRVERAVAGLPGVGRVHVHRWGDGGAHFHLFFVARPSGMQQLRGSCLVVWDDILPPVDEETWRDNLTAVARVMARDGGEAVAA